MSQTFEKNAFTIPVSREMLDDINAMRPVYQAMQDQTLTALLHYAEDVEYERIHGPQLRPTRREYNAVMAPTGQHERKVRSLKWNVPNLHRLHRSAFLPAN